MNTNKTKVLILGAQGMLGRIIYKYLKGQLNIHCIGTARSDSKSLITFKADKVPNSWNKLTKQTFPIDFVINTIAILNRYPDKPTPPSKEYYKINSDFPLFLQEKSRAQKYKLIHFSTDAVFSENQKAATEHTSPQPNTIYGKSKLKGEVTGRSSLTIRTSLIGYDPRNKKGVIESVKLERNDIKNYTNHLWTGSTTLQLAKLVHWLIIRKGFSKIKNKSSLLHYAPLGPITKYFLVKEIAKINNKNFKLQKLKDKEESSRYLSSIYQQLLPNKILNYNISQSIQKLRKYETK